MVEFCFSYKRRIYFGRREEHDYQKMERILLSGGIFIVTNVTRFNLKARDEFISRISGELSNHVKDADRLPQPWRPLSS